DEDDEVRDRVTLSLSLLTPSSDPTSASLLLSPLPLPWHNLERAVMQFTQHAAGTKPLTFQSLPVVEDLPPPPSAHQTPSGAGSTSAGGGKSAPSSSTGATSAAASSSSSSRTPPTPSVDAAAALAAVPALASLGRVFRSTFPPVPLTESETEYVVTCIKHIYEDGQTLVLHFSVVNTIPEQKLLNVRVHVDPQ
ncbi:hypothetical protein VYU27_010675, partial [Nannochloropsis oceanica]